MPKKDFLPKDISDLEDIFYNPANYQKKRKYESYLDTKFLDKIREAESKKIMVNFGEAIKIPTRAGIKTPDFTIEESKIVFEITSIQLSEKEIIKQGITLRSEQEIITDINKAMDHAVEKDYSNFTGYQRVVIIFIDTILSAMCPYTQFCSDPEFIKKTVFVNSGLSHMIIVPMPSSISNGLHHTAYSQNEILAKDMKGKLPEKIEVFHM
jgi:hypothetical protein